jgi:hypothetical protein
MKRHTILEICLKGCLQKNPHQILFIYLSTIGDIAQKNT